MTGKLRRATLLLPVFLCAVLLIAPGPREALLDILALVRSTDGPGLRDEIQNYGLLGPLVSLGLAQLHVVVPYPATILALANGLAFGFWLGLATTWSGFMLSSVVMYAAGNALGRPLLRRFVSDEYRAGLEGWLAREGPYPLLLVRLIPVVPFNAVCLAAGALGVRFRTYLWTTGLGILPMDAALSYVGARLGAEGGLGPWFWVILTFLVVFVLVAWRLSKRIDLPEEDAKGA